MREKGLYEDVRTIHECIRNIYEEGELVPQAIVKKFCYQTVWLKMSTAATLPRRNEKNICNLP